MLQIIFPIPLCLSFLEVSIYYNFDAEEYKQGFIARNLLVDEVLGFKIGRLICSDINDYNIPKYKKLNPSFIVIQAMAVKFS